MLSQGLNLVAQIVKKQGGTVHVRSNKGLGTTVKVSLPLLSPPSTPFTKSRTNSLDLTSPPASVGFFGFRVIEADPTTEQLKAKANKRLLSSIKRYCMELGLLVHAADDNLDSNATVQIISEQALRRLPETKEKDLRRSLLSADSLQKPMIIICNTRNSALKLQSGVLERDLPPSTQYLWLPIGPAKIAAALSAYCTCHQYFTTESTNRECEADMILAGVCKGSESDVAAFDGATKASPDVTQEKGDRAQLQSFGDIILNSRDDDKDEGVVSHVFPTDDAVDENALQVPRSSQSRRSGEEVSEKPLIASEFSLPMRTQIARASTAASASTGAFSLLLVDDNVSKSSKLTSSKSC